MLDYIWEEYLSIMNEKSRGGAPEYLTTHLRKLRLLMESMRGGGGVGAGGADGGGGDALDPEEQPWVLVRHVAGHVLEFDHEAHEAAAAAAAAAPRPPLGAPAREYLGEALRRASERGLRRHLRTHFSKMYQGLCHQLDDISNPEVQSIQAFCHALKARTAFEGQKRGGTF